MITEHAKKESVRDKKEHISVLGKIKPGVLVESIKDKLRSRKHSQPQPNQQDLIYQGKDVDLRKIPIAREMYLKKKDTILGNRFKKTLLGYTKGATNQYRGPYSTHVREYSDHYTIHRDFIDPRRNPISHLAKDAPMELAGWIIGGLIALLIIVFIIF